MVLYWFEVNGILSKYICYQTFTHVMYAKWLIYMQNPENYNRKLQIHNLECFKVGQVNGCVSLKVTVNHPGNWSKTIFVDA